MEQSSFGKKRAALEQFVKEQIIGPGAFNKRYFLLNEWDQNEFKDNDLHHCEAIDNCSEVLAELPAYQYSSAILFPISKITGEGTSNTGADDPTGHDPDNEVNEIKADDENFEDDQFESTSSKNQNYPNTCGLSLAIAKEADPEQQLKIDTTFRQYRKVSQHDCQDRSLGLWVDQHTSEIAQLIPLYFNGIFEIIERSGNSFICLVKGVNINEHLYALDYINLERFAQEKLLPLIKVSFPDKELFKATSRVYDGTTYNFTTIYEDTLIDEMQKKIKEDLQQLSELQDLIKWLEIFTQVKQLANDLKAIYRKSSGRNFPTPIWASVFFSKQISLPALAVGKVVQRGEIAVEGFPQLMLSYQYLKEDEAIFIKLILVNRAIIELKSDEPPQLNKKDKANHQAFFGVRMAVAESVPDIIVPYNPPNLLIIDEEDNFNKLLYRQYKDYGEGYNTSVTWGEQTQEPSLKYIATEFIPEQETPSVDYNPTKIENGKAETLIGAGSLSIGALSTLSPKREDEVIDTLTDIVNAYDLWINTKRQQLSEDAAIRQGKQLLEKQLNACENDRKRLARNISLLKNDPAGMAAFRIMNTAMFMQLHHGRSIKAAKKGNGRPFIPASNDEGFYKDAFRQNNYAWRSFQLAFILLNIDGFIRPAIGDRTVTDVFGTGWPERNELADLVWFPTGGGKTEAYLGLIAFAVAYRRFTKTEQESKGTSVLMRYTLRLLTLQQFQRATLLICALEVIRKENFRIPGGHGLGHTERITIGLFVGKGSLPNTWEQMKEELDKITEQLIENRPVRTNLPHTECPWCGGALFIDQGLTNVEPRDKDSYGINNKLSIMCNSPGCAFHSTRPNDNKSLPLRLFDEDIYKFPPTLLFGTVDKFAALANKVSTNTSERNKDSRRLLGQGYGLQSLPPELIIQDELHLLLGPLGSAVGLFEKGVDELCSYTKDGIKIRPKIITSTATTRNTDKQIFALFNRRCEIFPKQGINCDDSFFSFYKRQKDNVQSFDSNRRYLGLLPVGKTQVWMQLRLASICLAHRVKYLIDNFGYQDIQNMNSSFFDEQQQQVFDYYHTVLSYFNSLKEVGKTQSQLSHYLPGDLNLVVKNTLSWSFFAKLIKKSTEIDYSELTGRLSGEEVKTNLAAIEHNWGIFKKISPPEFVISTNMISVGIDVSRFNTMIINSMPRNTAEYIQASSRVARDKEGIVFTVHHPFRSRDISHYQRFKEFHEKFYSYVEPISITPFANKALDRYFAMYLAMMIRHNIAFGLSNNDAARSIDQVKINSIKSLVLGHIKEINNNAVLLNSYLDTRTTGVRSNVEGIIGDEELFDIAWQIDDLMIKRWLDRITGQDPVIDLKFRDDVPRTSLYKPRNTEALDDNWNVKESLREIAPSVVIKTVQQ